MITQTNGALHDQRNAWQWQGFFLNPRNFRNSQFSHSQICFRLISHWWKCLLYQAAVRAGWKWRFFIDYMGWIHRERIYISICGWILYVKNYEYESDYFLFCVLFWISVNSWEGVESDVHTVSPSSCVPSYTIRCYNKVDRTSWT